MAKSPDGALHPFGDSSHRCLRLRVSPQLAFVLFRPCAALNPTFRVACRGRSFDRLFRSFSHSLSPQSWNHLIDGTTAATLSTDAKVMWRKPSTSGFNLRLTPFQNRNCPVENCTRGPRRLVCKVPPELVKKVQFLLQSGGSSRDGSRGGLISGLRLAI